MQSLHKLGYMEILLKHTSIRKFSDKAIEPNILEAVLHAATRASNTGNMQLYSIVVTQNAETKTKLCQQAHFNQKMVQDAPVVLTFCADLHRFTAWCNQRNAEPGYDNFLSFYTASIDATIAAQNACIAAEELGLGICYLGTTNYLAQPIIDILKLPALVVPVTTVVLGYPAETPELTHRLPLDAVVHFEEYKSFSASKIDELHAYKEALDESKKFVLENEVENLAQVFTKKRYATKNNKLFSQSLLGVIQKQGFMNNL
jgi:nitroreductase